jgi:predicted ATP-grasp superfamily ATP-dependent carboligase
MSARVLVLGGRSPVALDHARRFAAQGWQVHVADSIPCRLSASSRAVHACHRIAPPRFEPGGFVRDLAALISARRIDLVLPSNEEALYLSAYRGRLPAAVQVAVEDFALVSALHSKWDFVNLARAHGMPVPDSARVQDLAQARAWAGDRPVVLKPEFSRFGVHVRLYPRGIPADAPELPPLGPWVVQELLQGTELCSYAIAWRGQLRALACYAPRHRLGRSASFYFEPVQRDDITRAVAALVAGTGYTGQISFDWIVGADGCARALECNPRATSGLHLFPADAALPAALAGEDVSCTPDLSRPRMLGAVMLGAGLPAALRSGRQRQWWRDWSRAGDVLARPGDRLPLAGAVADIGAYTLLAARQGVNLRQASTRDIEWDGEALAGSGA